MMSDEWLIICSREQTEMSRSVQEVSFYGLVRIKGFWLPFVLTGISVVMGQPVFHECLGIFVGHLWWFLNSLLPRATGEAWLPTPRCAPHLV
jgi:hypothetical protein